MIESGHTGYVVENFRIINTPGQPEKRERYVEHYSASPDEDRPRHRRRAAAAADRAGDTATPAPYRPADARKPRSRAGAGRRLTHR